MGGLQVIDFIIMFLMFLMSLVKKLWLRTRDPLFLRCSVSITTHFAPVITPEQWNIGTLLLLQTLTATTNGTLRNFTHTPRQLGTLSHIQPYITLEYHSLRKLDIYYVI